MRYKDLTTKQKALLQAHSSALWAYINISDPLNPIEYPYDLKKEIEEQGLKNFAATPADVRKREGDSW